MVDAYRKSHLASIIRLIRLVRLSLLMITPLGLYVYLLPSGCWPKCDV